MAKEHYIYGKRDTGHHNGRFSNEKSLQESIEYTRNELFFDLYGHPMSWCEWFSKLSSPLGEIHKGHLVYFNKATQGIKLRT